MIQRELCSVGKVLVPLAVTDVAGVVEQGRDDRSLCTMCAEPFRRVDATLITRHQAGQSQRHVQRMLHVVVGGIATEIAGILAREETPEVVKRKPQPIE